MTRKHHEMTSEWADYSWRPGDGVWVLGETCKVGKAHCRSNSDSILLSWSQDGPLPASVLHTWDKISKIINVRMAFPFTTWQTKEETIVSAHRSHGATPENPLQVLALCPSLKHWLNSLANSLKTGLEPYTNSLTDYIMNGYTSPAVTQNGKPALKAPSGCRLKCKCTWRRSSHPSCGVYASITEPLDERGPRKLKH